jgi:uncharacterized protein (DUF2141 family)
MIGTSLKFKPLAIGALFSIALTVAASAGLAQAPAAPAPTPAPAAAKATLTVRITGIKNAKGKINIALFRDAKGFPTDSASAVASQRFEIDPQTLVATAVFKDIPQGAYAAAVLHDDDLSGKMAYDGQGIPQKGYGISNNPNTNYGPPTPEQATFTVNQAEVTIEIKMVYWQ